MHIDISCSVMYCETAREVWIELKNRYSQGNAPKIYNLQKEISHICQNQLTAADYFTKCKCLWDQLLNYDSLPECSCGAVKSLNDCHDNSYVMRFLMSLNESFSTIRSQILMSNPLPSMGRFIHLFFKKKHKNILDVWICIISEWSYYYVCKLQVQFWKL